MGLKAEGNDWYLVPYWAVVFIYIFEHRHFNKRPGDNSASV
jgi:hypothetical protein